MTVILFNRHEKKQKWALSGQNWSLAIKLHDGNRFLASVGALGWSTASKAKRSWGLLTTGKSAAAFPAIKDRAAAPGLSMDTPPFPTLSLLAKLWNLAELPTESYAMKGKGPALEQASLSHL